MIAARQQNQVCCLVFAAEVATRSEQHQAKLSQRTSELNQVCCLVFAAEVVKKAGTISNKTLGVTSVIFFFVSGSSGENSRNNIKYNPRTVHTWYHINLCETRLVFFFLR